MRSVSETLDDRESSGKPFSERVEIQVGIVKEHVPVIFDPDPAPVRRARAEVRRKLNELGISTRIPI